MKVQKIIEVWLVKKRIPRPIDLVQYDTGIQLVFAIQDFTLPDGTTATLYVQKHSGMFVYQETGITVDGRLSFVHMNYSRVEYSAAMYSKIIAQGIFIYAAVKSLKKPEAKLKVCKKIQPGAKTHGNIVNFIFICLLNLQICGIIVKHL